MAPNSPDRFSKTQDAFSLLEVLVSTAILAVILVLFLTIFTAAQGGLTHLNNSMKQRQDARVVLAKIAGELKESFNSPSLSYEGNDPSARQFQLLINPPGMGDLANAHTLFWATASGSRDESGLIGYAVRWDKTDPSAPKPRLCRLFVSTKESQSALSDLKNSISGSWAGTNLVNTFAPGDEANGYRGWFADNVLALYVRALDPQNQPITRAARTITGISSPTATWYLGMSGVQFTASTQGPSYTNSYDSRLGYQYTHAFSNTSTLINRFGPALPASIEIALVAASPEAIGRITSIPTPVSGSSSTNMWTDIQTFIDTLPPKLKSDVHTYSTIVPISQWR